MHALQAALAARGEAAASTSVSALLGALSEAGLTGSELDVQITSFGALALHGVAHTAGQRAAGGTYCSCVQMPACPGE